MDSLPPTPLPCLAPGALSGLVPRDHLSCGSGSGIHPVSMTGCFPRVLWLDASPSPTRAWGRSPPREACVYFTLHTFFQHKEAQAEASRALAGTFQQPSVPRGWATLYEGKWDLCHPWGGGAMAGTCVSELSSDSAPRPISGRKGDRQAPAETFVRSRGQNQRFSTCWSLAHLPQTHHRVGAHRGSRPRSSAAAPDRQCRNTSFPEASGEVEVLPLLADL